MLTSEQLNRLMTNLNNAINSEAKNIALVIYYTNGKSDTVNAKEDGTFIKTPQILVDCLYVVGKADNIGEVESTTETTEIHRGDYVELLKPLSIIESIDLKYRGKVITTISEDKTPSTEA